MLLMFKSDEKRQNCNNYIAIQVIWMVNKQFGLEINNNFFSGSLLVILANSLE